MRWEGLELKLTRFSKMGVAETIQTIHGHSPILQQPSQIKKITRGSIIKVFCSSFRRDYMQNFELTLPQSDPVITYEGGGAYMEIWRKEGGE